MIAAIIAINAALKVLTIGIFDVDVALRFSTKYRRTAMLTVSQRDDEWTKTDRMA